MMARRGPTQPATQQRTLTLTVAGRSCDFAFFDRSDGEADFLDPQVWVEREVGCRDNGERRPNIVGADGRFESDDADDTRPKPESHPKCARTGRDAMVTPWPMKWETQRARSDDDERAACQLAKL